MKIFKQLGVIAALLILVATYSCSNSKSYAELLTDENRVTNSFLVNQKVIGSIPTDSVFEVGIDAPFYQLDDNGDIFMQVLNAGTPGNKAEVDQLIYFRFTRYSLYSYSYDGGKNHIGGYYGEFSASEGNDTDLTYGSASFRFDNLNSNSSYQWGSGLQYPLKFLSIDCDVNLVIKSQAGLNSEISSVVPYLYRVRYFKSQI